MAKVKSVKVSGPTEPEHIEHPDDQAARLKAVEWAKGAIDLFVRNNPKRLAQLIQVYEDAKAEELLTALRDDFWSQDQTKGARHATRL